MKKFLLIFTTACFSSTTLAIDITPYQEGQRLNQEQARELLNRYKQREKQAWIKPRSADEIKNHKDAASIQYGIQVLDKTLETIGPGVQDKTKRYSGNSLNCSSCHLKGDTQLPGTKYDALPFTNVSNDYPQFRSRTMSIVTATARINGCMTRSMGDGKELPSDSKEMKGILAYFDWLSEGSKKNDAMAGSGVPELTLPNRQARVKYGEAIYSQFCASCHGEKALGSKAEDYDNTGRYIFPPLAGDDSFNNGAGMSRLIKASAFVHANMPLGTTSKNPVLTIEQAYDVTAYFLSLPRTERKDRHKDFPDPDFRPVDYPVAEYFNGDNKALNKARLGPYTK